MLNIRCYEKDVKREMSEFFTDCDRDTHAHTLTYYQCELSNGIRKDDDNLVLPFVRHLYPPHQTDGSVDSIQKYSILDSFLFILFLV